MRVLFLIAEMAPLVKVGGLADIGGALPRALRELGVDARVALPFYAGIDRSGDRTETAKIATLPDGAALENAISIAGMVLTTNCLVTDLPEKNDMPAMPGGMGGMPGGMGGMPPM